MESRGILDFPKAVPQFVFLESTFSSISLETNHGCQRKKVADAPF